MFEFKRKVEEKKIEQPPVRQCQCICEQRVNQAFEDLKKGKSSRWLDTSYGETNKIILEHLGLKYTTDDAVIDWVSGIHEHESYLLSRSSTMFSGILSYLFQENLNLIYVLSDNGSMYVSSVQELVSETSCHINYIKFPKVVELIEQHLLKETEMVNETIEEFKQVNREFVKLKYTDMLGTFLRTLPDKPYFIYTDSIEKCVDGYTKIQQCVIMEKQTRQDLIFQEV